jgi:hypothetical protein
MDLDIAITVADDRNRWRSLINSSFDACNGGVEEKIIDDFLPH